MPPRAAATKRSTRRIIEDEESDEPDEEVYDDEEEDEEQLDEGDEEDEVDELDEDEDYTYEEELAPAASTSKTGLKIKLNMGAAKIKAGGTVLSTPTPGETPPFALPRVKRTNKRRAIVASEEDEAEIADEDEEDDEAFLAPAASSAPSRMTARQAAMAGGAGTVEHVALEEPPNPRKRKWTEEELAQRREEAARKRKLKGAQRQEDEKQMIINRLINKGTGKRGRWASKAKDPTPEANEEVEGEGAETGAAGEGTEAGEDNESTSNADEVPTGVVTPAPTRGGWRGRGRRGRGARIPPPPVRMHIPVMRWLSGIRDITIEGPDEPIQVDPTDLERGKDAGTASTTTTAQAPDQTKPQVEREAFISFSIPPELVAVTSIEEPVPPPAPRPAPTCAVKGCKLTRKYKLVGSPDPEVGACGMEHLKTLQSVH